MKCHNEKIDWIMLRRTKFVSHSTVVELIVFYIINMIHLLFIFYMYICESITVNAYLGFLSSLSRK